MDIDPKENSDLLTDRIKPETNGNVCQNEGRKPPDGGLRAYAVMVGSFLTNGLLFSVINSYSVIYAVLYKELQNNNIPNAETRASLVGSLTMGTTFFLSPISGVLTGLMGLRLTAVLGGAIATASFIISSFVVNNVNALYFTYSIMYGLGASFAYTPSLAILGHYFEKRLGLVNGVVTIGSSIFTVFMLPLMEYMIVNYGLDWMFRLLAVFGLGIVLCGLLFKPIPLTVISKPTREDDSFKSLFKSVVNVEIWKNKTYMLWAFSMPVALFGYFVPYVHMKEFTKINFGNVNENLPLQCIVVTSACGRLIFGFLADKPGIDRILLQQISFYVIGILTIILPFVRSYPLLVVISLGMGVFDGAFISLIGPIAFELCGASYAAQAIGCMLGLAAIPLSVGPSIAGHLFDLKKSYTLPFVLAGISPVLGATIMFAIRLYRRRENPDTVTANGHATSMTSSDVEKSPPLLLSSKENLKQQTAL